MKTAEVQALYSKYVFANYRPCTVLVANDFWHFVFLVRKDAHCSSDETRSGN